MKLSEISFPVYPLRRHRRIFEGSKGVVFIETDLGEIAILDDTSLEGTFNQRRLRLSLQLKTKDFRLYPLPKSYSTLGTMLRNRVKDNAKKYIDSTGKVFEYKPSKFYRLKYLKIIEKYVVKGKCAIILLDTINTPFKISSLPPDKFMWAGVLISDLGYILYDFSTDKLPDTVRKL